MPELLVTAHCPLARQQSECETIKESDTPMTNPTWTFDVKGRTAFHSSGYSIGFQREDDAWTARVFEREGVSGIRVKLPTMTGNILEAEALKLWQAQIDKALAMLTEAGEALHGKDWHAHFAADLRISIAQLEKWLNQKEPLTLADSQFAMVNAALYYRLEKITAVHEKINAAYLAARATEEPNEKKINGGKPLVRPPHEM
jgi:hypothetical protein